jgi:uncharacterized membrane protein YqjE
MMTTPEEDDPTRATLRVAQSVVGLVRAELGLALAEARASGARLAVTLALGGAALFTGGLAVVVVVLTPMFWTRSPSAALVTVAIALTLALVTGIATFLRLRSNRKPRTERPNLPPIHDVSGRDHAIPR